MSSMNLPCLQFISILVLCYNFGQGLGLHIKITPKTAVEQLTEQVEIKCTVMDTPYVTQSIMSIGLGKKGDHPLAVLQQQKLVSGPGIKSNMKAEGRIDLQNTTQSFLKITIKNPKAEDAGQYRCRIFYLDILGELKEGKVYAYLTVNDDIHEVVRYLTQQVKELIVERDDNHEAVRNLTQEMKEIEAKTDGYIVKDDNHEVVRNLTQQMKELKVERDDNHEAVLNLTQQVKELIVERDDNHEAVRNLTQEVKELRMERDDNQEAVRNLTQEVKELKVETAGYIAKDNVTSAFMAGYSSSDKVVQNQVMKFRDVKLNIGGNYNVGTNTYTAPVDGIYTFNLFVYVVSSNQRIQARIRVNGENMAGLDAWEKNGHDDQSSVSPVVQLKAGDAVNCYVSYLPGSDTAYGFPWTAFSGYLLKAI